MTALWVAQSAAISFDRSTSFALFKVAPVRSHILLTRAMMPIAKKKAKNHGVQSLDE